MGGRDVWPCCPAALPCGLACSNPGAQHSDPLQPAHLAHSARKGRAVECGERCS